MQVIGWSYDIAREQSPTLESLLTLTQRSQAAGHNLLGLYLEHRFAYPSAPWAASAGAVTPQLVRDLLKCRPSGLRLVPLLNTLGHMEGFIRAEGGQQFAEAPATGSLQICPSRPECRRFAQGLVADVLDVFDDEWVHIGGDETKQLGQCPACAARAQQLGPGGLYGEYFGELCRCVLQRGRRPCVWGDMLAKHPDALAALPNETLIFDWQYFASPTATSRTFRQRGFDVVCCPSVQSYASAWCFLDATQANIDSHLAAAEELGALGVMVTTWEASYFTSYAAILPLVYAAGRRAARRERWTDAIRAEGGPAYATVAEILGRNIPALSPFLAPGTWRRLRDAFVIRQNPFLLWSEWRADACGRAGDEILRQCAAADSHLADAPELRLAVELHRVAVLWVRLVESVAAAYRARDTRRAADELRSAGPTILNQLRPELLEIAAHGGSAADLARLDRLIAYVQIVCERLAALTPAPHGYRPSFETLIEPGYLPHDQAAWRAGA